MLSRNRIMGIACFLPVILVAIPSIAFAFLIGPKGIGPDGIDNDVITIGFLVRMSVQVKGIPANESRLVSVLVRDAGQQKKVTMQWIAMEPLKRDNGKIETAMMMRHYSTDDGGINNVRIHDNTVSFEIPGEYPRYPYKVFCKSNRPWLREIRVTRVLPVSFSEPDAQETYSEVWEMTDRILLPSLEVSGIDFRKPEWWVE